MLDHPALAWTSKFCTPLNPTAQPALSQRARLLKQSASGQQRALLPSGRQGMLCSLQPA